MKSLSMVSIVIALLLMASSSLDAAIGNDKAYKEAGNSYQPFYELGNRSEYLCVGYLKNGGSAVWIGGHWALTVAHAVNGDMAKNNVMILTTKTRTLEIPVISVYTPNQLLAKDGAADIALIKLRSIPRAPGLTPATVSGKEDILKCEVVCSGYGNIGLGSTGPQGKFQSDIRPHPGLRFGFQNVLDSYTNNGLVARFTFDEDGLPLEGCISPGDSGSGMFTKIDGKWQLIVINAHSETGPNGRFFKKSPVYGSHDGGTRVALFFPEIQKALTDDDPSPFESLAWEEIQNRIKRTEKKEQK